MLSYPLVWLMPCLKVGSMGGEMSMNCLHPNQPNVTNCMEKDDDTYETICCFLATAPITQGTSFTINSTLLEGENSFTCWSFEIRCLLKAEQARPTLIHEFLCTVMGVVLYFPLPPSSPTVHKKPSCF